MEWGPRFPFTLKSDPKRKGVGLWRPVVGERGDGGTPAKEVLLAFGINTANALSFAKTMSMDCKNVLTCCARERTRTRTSGYVRRSIAAIHSLTYLREQIDAPLNCLSGIVIGILSIALPCFIFLPLLTYFRLCIFVKYFPYLFNLRSFYIHTYLITW